MTKTECKGMTPATLPEEIREIFATHIEIVGDPNLKWERLFRYMVMENKRFPIDEDLRPICMDFFHAIHSGEIERFGTSIEAHLRAFGVWFPRYWNAKAQKRAFESLYTVPDQQPVPKAGWNLTTLTIGQIRETIRKYDQIMAGGGEKFMKITPGANSFMARCRESLRRYNDLNSGKAG